MLPTLTIVHDICTCYLLNGPEPISESFYCMNSYNYFLERCSLFFTRTMHTFSVVISKADNPE